MDELGLTLRGKNQITPAGALYVEKLSDTLHRVKKYRIRFIDHSVQEITHEQYENISNTLASLNGGSTFIRFRDGKVVSTGQIAYIEPYETIIDTRKETL